tara:strand:+ start:742 stop:1215 length:474 start_codon:yes stop_codon:yes gene_type:complete
MRRRKPKKRVYQPDPRFGDENVTFFVNNLMFSGKKSIAYKIFYDALDMASEKAGEGEDGYELWKKALKNIQPAVEVKSKRIGGSTYQIPVEVRPSRKRSITVKWMIKYARLRNGKSMADKLANEILAASKNEGAAVKKKEDTHRMAEANKAFSHFKF